MTDEAPINESSTPASVMVLASLLGKMVDCGCPIVGQVYEKKTSMGSRKLTCFATGSPLSIQENIGKRIADG
ncbi:hypothetical protein BPA01_42860 [Brevibacillus parabrevis]|uniref:Uncharacterized protein n=1 Tax=Brevibacillus parabrevis TaxID=54914 RepID=A0A4Y3PRX0_BREPA|nr:hypothetical protein BPA01_42860 [Brevibacillus parabrevis]